ncbi:MAG: alpha/beta hydrolase [Clostridiales bacterium]|jgi:acetyl esterase/lipase|nr:alpha/beta hydrolase [Clostridiales bacterium]
MIDYIRENLSYYPMYYRMLFRAKKEFTPERVDFGTDKEQYFLYYEPRKAVSDKVVIWIHGGGWNAGNPKFFDFVGQYMAGAGYRFVSLGYRLSPKNKYPAQIEDVCNGYNAALRYLKDNGIDTSRIIISGPSAGAHLSSILTYSKKVQDEYKVDISNVIGYIGFGGPYSFRKSQSMTVKMLEGMLFAKGYDRKQAEPWSLMTKNHVPMLLIQSRHDGVIEFGCAEDFADKARTIGNICEIYEVEDKRNTHSWYTAGCFLLSREENKTLDTFMSRIENL